MTALTSAVVLVGALGVVNLLLTFGIIRRLRQNAGTGNQPIGPAPGGLVAPVAPVGTEIRGTDLRWDGETLVGFFMPGCGPCEEQLPEFITYAPKWQRVVAVVMDPSGGKSDEAAETLQRLRQVAEVVVEKSPGDALHKAFKATGYPVYCTVRDGVVSSVAGRAANLAAEMARIPA